MTVLTWKKPKRVMSTQERNSISADGAPAGVYVPNMSRKDEMCWRAKFVGKTTDRPQVEIRRNGMIIIVSLGNGYKYKWYGSKGVNLHIASSGPQCLTFDEFEQMKEAVTEARQFLENFERERKK